MTSIERTHPRTSQAESSNSATTRAHDQLLVSAAAVFAVVVLIHGADHARRGADSLNRDVFWAGTAGIALEVGVVLLACQRHRWAPLAAAVTGFSLALGYVVVHFLPERSLLSDSLSSGVDVSRLSWAAASGEVMAALALGLAGLVVLRPRGGLASATRPNPAQQELGRAARHPIVVIMALGNAVILAISLIQLA